MTREEEIEHTGKSYCKDCVALKFPSCDGKLKESDIIAAYRAGAEWADKTMSDKAYNWLKENAHKYHWYDPIEDDEGVRWNDMVEDLRKVMEE